MKQDNRFQIMVRPESFSIILSKETQPAEEDGGPNIKAGQAFLGHPVCLAVQVIHRPTPALPQPVPIVLTNGVKADSRLLRD